MMDIVAVVCFVFSVCIMCHLHSHYSLKKYEKEKSNKKKLIFGKYDCEGKLVLVGVEKDNNVEYPIAMAIRKIEISDDLRIRV